MHLNNKLIAFNIFPEIFQTELIDKLLHLAQKVLRSSADLHEVEDMMNQAAKIVLSESGFKIYRSVSDFYNKLERDQSFLSQHLQIQLEIAKLLISRVPIIKAIYGAGQFYCDAYNPIARRYLALVMEILESRNAPFNEERFLKRDIPDYDLILIINYPGLKQWMDSDSFDSQLKMTLSLFQEQSGWLDLQTQLIEQFGLSGIKYTTNPVERQNVISGFARSRALILCLCNSIPNPLWEHIPLMFLPEDYKYLNCLRDLMISLPGPLVNEAGFLTNIPGMYQRNLFLNSVSRHPSITFNEFIKILFAMVYKTMPHRPPHDSSPGLVNYAKRNWFEIIKQMQMDGLILLHNDRYTLTNKGRELMNKLRHERMLWEASV